MAKALVAGDRERFTALAATREEMEELLTTAQPPGNARERQELKTKVAEIVAGRRQDFDRMGVTQVRRTELESLRHFRRGTLFSFSSQGNATGF
jgi:hypothetical protein